MPRCRLGYIHVVNNDFTQWEMYAIGGSANPTINSQGNRYTAPSDPNAKEVRFVGPFGSGVVVILLFYPFWLLFSILLFYLFDSCF
jgi:hypothetical protein